MQSNAKRVVICDLGGVGLKLRNMKQWWEKLFYKSCWCNAGEFKRAKEIALEVAWKPFERREKNADEFQMLFRAILRLESMDIEGFWRHYTNIIEGINTPLVECLCEMRKRGVVLALLSNLDAERYKYICEKCSYEYETITAPFHYLFFSYQIGSRKPEQKIYRHVFREISILPQYAYYIEDWQPNIEGMAAAIPDMPRENMLLYSAYRHHEEAVPFFRRHDLIA